LILQSKPKWRKQGDVMDAQNAKWFIATADGLSLDAITRPIVGNGLLK
jgi:hypothetical protein